MAYNLLHALGESQLRYTTGMKAAKGGKAANNKLLLLAVASLLLLAVLILAVRQPSAGRKTLAPASGNLARQAAATIYIPNAGPLEREFIACVEQAVLPSSPLVRLEVGQPPDASIASDDNVLDKLRAGLFSRRRRRPTPQEVGEKFTTCMAYCNQQQVDCGTRGYAWCALVGAFGLRAIEVTGAIGGCVYGEMIRDDFNGDCPGWYKDNVCGPQHWSCQHKCREEYRKAQNELIRGLNI